MIEGIPPRLREVQITRAAMLFSSIEQTWLAYYGLPDDQRADTAEEFAAGYVEGIVEMGYDRETAAAISRAAQLVVCKAIESGLAELPPQRGL